MDKPTDKHRVVGQRVPKIDGAALVTGEAKFTADYRLPGMLYGKILRSTVPNARIVSIDASRARQLPGVRAVVTGHDTLKRHLGMGLPGPQGAAEYGMAFDRVRYIGEEIAAVAAVDELTAEKALDLITVQYEELPYVLDPEEAMKDSAPLVHEHLGTNIAHTIAFTHGDPEAGFARAAHIRTDRFATESTNHCALEPHTALASYERGGTLTVWTSTQSPMRERETLSVALGLPQNAIRIIKPYVGGGFGGKNGYVHVEFCASVLSMATGRPVLIALTREEVFAVTKNRHPLIINLRTGMTKDGIITAREAHVVLDSGAYGSMARMMLGRLFNELTMVYRTPAIACKGVLVHTNKATFGPQRGFHGQQIRHADELQIDLLARDLDLDPLDVRLANAIEGNETTPHGNIITSCGLKECLEKVAQRSGYRAKRRGLPPGKGIAVAAGAYICGGGPPIISSEIIRFDLDGSIVVLTGASDIGQGSNGLLAQIVAEELGVTIDRIRVISADTDVTPPDGGTFASRLTVYAGNAMLNAARDVRRKLMESLGDQLDIPPEQLDMIDNQIIIRDTGKVLLPLEAAVRRCPPLLGRGHFQPKDVEEMDFATGTGNWSPAYNFGAEVAEIAIDEATGQIAVERITAAFDCGYAINPLALEGQINGAISQGMGQALSETVLRDRRGAALNPSFLTYKLPLVGENPEITPIIVETIDPVGPFGAEGVSEGMLLPAPPAIVNAVYNATNKMIKTTPLQADKVYSQISDLQGQLRVER
jgi:4-hydroxybenzoyl-CoA reductase subunit alpha